MVNYVRLWRNILAQLGISLYFQLTKDLLLVVLYKKILIFDPFYNSTDKISWFIIQDGVEYHTFFKCNETEGTNHESGNELLYVVLEKLFNYTFVYSYINYLLFKSLKIKL